MREGEREECVRTPSKIDGQNRTSLDSAETIQQCSHWESKECVSCRRKMRESSKENGRTRERERVDKQQATAYRQTSIYQKRDNTNVEKCS